MASDMHTITPVTETDDAVQLLVSNTTRQPIIPGLLGGRGEPVATPHGDTVQVPVSSRVVRDVQWEVGRSWSVDPDRVQLTWGNISGEVPDRIVSVRLLGTGAGGYWIALLASADPMATPARIRVRAGVERLVPVAASRLTRGLVLSVDDIAHTSSLVWGPPKDTSGGVQPGWVVHRVFSKGDELKTPGVRRPNAVESGTEVEIIWKRGSVAVSLMGVALGSGPIGSRIRVRTETGRRLEGVATKPGVVVVGGTEDKGWSQ